MEQLTPNFAVVCLFLLIMAALKRLVVKCMVGEAGEVLLHEPGVGVARQVVLDLFKRFFY